ncbi:hypothetical protein PLEOSDRAFT_1109434 [Pleurotus ostreatus PC15]|uniref:Uncharacterized protein n=1 Tax=Pleurotus ostreatus (strain PC15) TaxID=1137138 RepID=A0A067N5W1_PLEO1|nr:hypothetical protein PLEOSDRAFT_1109434 [Pleurotus ostreatus PC15]
MAPNQPLFLTASNIQGRPDRDSTWLAIPMATSYGEVAIKKEHNASFSVVVLENNVPATTAYGVTCVRTMIDIEMCEPGIYSSRLDLQSTTVIRIYAPSSQKKLVVSRGFVQARDAETLIIYADGISRPQHKKKSRSESLQKLRQVIDDAMDMLADSETSNHEKLLAKQVAETTLFTFVDLAMQ